MAARHGLRQPDPQRTIRPPDPMSQQLLHTGPRGGTIHSHASRQGDVFQVCLGTTCLLCESMHVGMAHLNRMERTLQSAAAGDHRAALAA